MINISLSEPEKSNHPINRTAEPTQTANPLAENHNFTPLIYPAINNFCRWLPGGGLSKRKTFQLPSPHTFPEISFVDLQFCSEEMLAGGAFGLKFLRFFPLTACEKCVRKKDGCRVNFSFSPLTATQNSKFL